MNAEDIRNIDADTFWSRVDMSGGPKSCWPWGGAKKPKGYGNVRVNKRYLSSHRVAFVLVNGQIPLGMMVCHVCDNPSCCNPRHLMLGNAKSNGADMVFKGRQKDKKYAARGERNWNSRFTAEQVRDIRRKYQDQEMNQYQLADAYGVTQTAISKIIRREAWGHIQ